MDSVSQPEKPQDKVAISVTGLSKAYRIWRDPASRLKAPLWNLLGKLIPAKLHTDKLRNRFNNTHNTHYHQDFFALKNIDFEINKGEVVGIVGKNGSGKSTLLQIICGTLTPTTGHVMMEGRVAALLELGSGFNPEFTGRENVFLNGAVLGINRIEMERRLPRILNFADIGEFIDQPIKTYSSGMSLRLAFAVQVTVEPDVLIVDEALAVGDESFQLKCFNRIKELKERGTTILLVSHDAGSIINICDKAIMLRSGSIFVTGSPKSVITIYQKSLAKNESDDQELLEDFRKLENHSPHTFNSLTASSRSDSNEQETDDKSFYDSSIDTNRSVEYQQTGVTLSRPIILNEKNKKVNVLQNNKSYTIRYRAEFNRHASNVKFGCMFKTIEGIELCGSNTSLGRNTVINPSPGSKLEINFNFDCHILPGTYTINIGATEWNESEEKFISRQVDSYLFRVFEDNSLNNHGHVSLVTSDSVTYI